MNPKASHEYRPPNPTRIGACGKLIYRHKKDAKANLRRLTRNRENHDKPGDFRPYWCERCEGWHLGHSVDRVKGEPS